MKRSRLFVAVLAALFSVVPAGAARAQEVLQIIPDDAIGFALVNRVGATNEKVTTLANKLKIPMPGSPLDMLKGALGVEKGLAEKGSLAVAAFAGKDGSDEPSPLFFVPVSNYQDFIKQFEPDDPSAPIAAITLKDGKELVAAKRGNYAIMAAVADRALLERALKTEKSLAAAVEPIAAWLKENDASGVLTPSGVKLIAAKAREGIAMAKQQFENLPPEAQAVGQMFDAMDRFLKSVETDVTHAGVGLRLDDAGSFQVSAQALFAKGSGFAKAGAGVQAPPGGPLSGLPSGPFVLALGGAVPEKTMLALMNMNSEIMKAAGMNIPEESIKKLGDVYAQMMKGMKGMSMVWQVGKEGQPAFASLAASMHTDDAAAYMVNYEKSIAVMNELAKELNLPFLPSYEIKKVKVEGKPALEMSVDLAAVAGLPEEMQGMFKNMFGADGKMTVSMAARDDKNVVMRYTPASGLKELLSAKTGLAADPGIAQANKLLPASSQWALYVSPAGATEFAGRMVKAFSPFPIEIPRFPATPPVALGAKISAQSFEMRLVVPSQVIDNVGGYVDQMKKIFNPVQ
jgi:hypothetical protein